MHLRTEDIDNTPKTDSLRHGAPRGPKEPKSGTVIVPQLNEAINFNSTLRICKQRIPVPTYSKTTLFASTLIIRKTTSHRLIIHLLDETNTPKLLYEAGSISGQLSKTKTLRIL